MTRPYHRTKPLPPHVPDERELAMIEMRYAGHTLQDIGNRFHLTRERVRQILTRAGLKSLKSTHLADITDTTEPATQPIPQVRPA